VTVIDDNVGDQGVVVIGIKIVEPFEKAESQNRRGLLAEYTSQPPVAGLPNNGRGRD
jgi:hypothetical protein